MVIVVTVFTVVTMFTVVTVVSTVTVVTVGAHFIESWHSWLLATYFISKLDVIAYTPRVVGSLN